MTLKQALPQPAREITGPDAVPDTRPDLGLRSADWLSGREWQRRLDYHGNPIHEPRPRRSYREVGVVIQQEPQFGRVTTSRTGWYGAATIQRTVGSSVGGIVRR
jgi:hypothetical protein